MPGVKKGVMSLGYGSLVLGLVGLGVSAYGVLVLGDLGPTLLLALPLHPDSLGIAVLYSVRAVTAVATDRPSVVLGLLALAGAGGLTNAVASAAPCIALVFAEAIFDIL